MGCNFASVKRKDKLNEFNRSPKRGGHKDAKTMDKNKMIVMLQYRIQRYQQMGNGTMCQNLLSELNRLQGTAKAAAKVC